MLTLYSIMKRFCTLLLLVILCGFDWKPQSNELLRSEMISYASSFRDECVGQRKIKRILTTFLKDREADKDQYRWIGATYQTVAKLEEICPPSADNRKIREKILGLLDYPIHVNNYDKNADVKMLQSFYSSTSEYLMRAKEQMMSFISTPGSEGLEIFKFYNMGFVIKNGDKTIGIDITDKQGLPEQYIIWSQEDYSTIASALDILFLTHPHSDHYSITLLQAMLSAGKTIVLPCKMEGLNLDKAGECVVLDKTMAEPMEICGIKVLALCGNQGENIPCNIYLLDIDGRRIVHNGDNYDRSIEALLANHSPAEVIIASSWNKVQSILSYAMSKDVRQIFIPAHENELCHSVDHRESYRELFTREDRLGNKDFQYPTTILLDNGEQISLSADCR